MARYLVSAAFAAVIAGHAGGAAAEITLSGDARMGISNDFVFGAGNDDTVFNSRARVTFTMTGSTDGGLEFGASFRADNAGAAAGGTAGSVYASGAFGKLSMGDVDGAAQAAVGNVDGVGLTGLGDWNELIFTATGGSDLGVVDTAFSGLATATSDTSALYEYATGALSFYASATQPSHTFVADGNTWQSKAYALGAAYSMDAYKVSIGYEKIEGARQPPASVASFDVESWIIGADATFGAVTVKARYGKGGSGINGTSFQDHEQWALSAAYTMDAMSVTGYASHRQFTNSATDANKTEVDAIGLGASYDLGGGAAVKGGIVQLEQTIGAAATRDDTAFDLGLSFSF